MPFMAALPAIMGIGGSILSLFSKPKPAVQTTNSSSNTNSSMTPTLSPELQAVMSQLLGNQQGIINDPTAGLGAIKTNAQEQINRNYLGAPDRIQTQLSKRGYGSSGKYGGAMYNLEGSRLSSLSGVDSDFAKIGADRQSQSSALIAQILASMRGSDTTSQTTGTQTTTGMPVQQGTLGQIGSTLGNIGQLIGVLKGGKQPSTGPVYQDNY